MATRTYDEFASAAARKYPGATEDQLRAAYTQKYGGDAVRTQGPTRAEYTEKVRAKYGDAITDEQIDEAYEKKYGASTFTELKRAGKHGLATAGQLGGAIIGGLGANDLGFQLFDYSRQAEEANRRSADVQSRPSYSPLKVATQLTDLAGSMLPTLGAGGGLGVGARGLGAAASVARGLGGGVAAGLGGAQEGGGLVAQRMAEGVPLDQARREGLGFGAAVGGLSILPVTRILGRTPGRIKTGLAEAATEIAEEPTAALITGKDPIDATIQGVQEVGLPAFLLGAALGKSGRQTPAERVQAETEFRQRLEPTLDGIAAPASAPPADDVAATPVSPVPPAPPPEAAGAASEPGALPAAAAPHLSPEQRRRAVAEIMAKPTDEMSLDEARLAMRTNPLTGLPNKRAYEESQKLPGQVSIDLDGLKFINDTLGHQGGDQFLRQFANLAAEISEYAYHASGDEFMLQANTEADADALAQLLTQRARDSVFEVMLPDGRTFRQKGISFGYGIGKDFASADAQLTERKAARRTRRGDAAGEVSITGGAPAARSQRAADVAGVPDVPATGDEARQYAVPGPGEGLLRSEPAADRPGPAGQEVVTTAAGRSIAVAPTIVEADDLITSDREGFPHELQPRDRSRAASVAQVETIARELRPELLGLSPDADRGAPIIGPDGVVESGNGRVMALRRAYEAVPAKAKSYRDWLTSQGFDVSGFKNPVLVRTRRDDLSPSERQTFTIEANQSGTMRMAATEQSRADAALLDGQLLASLTDGDLTAQGNDAFVKGFLGRLPVAERGELVGSDGRVNATGIRRLHAALIGKAYGSSAEASATLDRMLESTADDVKSVTGAMLDAAPAFAELRQAIEAGAVDPSFDLSADLAGAVEQLSALRTSRQSPAEYLAQGGLFGENTRPALLLRAFHNPDMKRAAPRSRVAELLTFYAKQAQAQNTNQTGLFGGEAVTPEQLLAHALDIFHGSGRIADEHAASRAPMAPVQPDWSPQDVASIVGRWGQDAPRLVIARNAGELPEAILQSLGPDIRGATDLSTGTVYLVRSNLPTRFDAERVLAHEAVGHFGMNRLLGDRWGWALDRVQNLKGNDPIIRQIAREIEATYGALDAETESAEIIAHLAERSPKHPLTQKVIAWLREALRSLGFRVNLSRNDLVSLINRAGASLERTGPVTGEWAGKTLASRKGRPYWADELESVGGKIDPDGTVLLYHATTKEIAEKILATGVLKRPADAPDSYGVYFGSNPSVRDHYGDGTVVPVRVKAAHIKPDDVFPGERLDFTAPTRSGIYRPVAVGEAALRAKPDTVPWRVERVALTFGQAREAAKAFVGQDLHNTASGITARVSRNSLDKMLNMAAVSKSGSPAMHALAVANLDTLFERAQFGWSKQDRAGNENVAAIHRLFAPLVYDGRAMLAKITVKEIRDPNIPNRVYSVEAVEFNEESPAVKWVDASAAADGISLTSIRPAGDIRTLAEQVQGFKGEGNILASRVRRPEEQADLAPMPETYISGDRVRYTGKTSEKYGATWYEFERLDGHKKGEKGVTQKAPPKERDRAQEQEAAAFRLELQKAETPPATQRDLFASRMNRDSAEQAAGTGMAPPPGGGERPSRIDVGGGSFSLEQFGALDNRELATLTGVMQNFDSPLEAERRGTRPWDVTEQAALKQVQDQLGITLDSLVTRKAGSTANAEQLLAYGMVLADATRQVQALAERAAATNSRDDLLALAAAKEKLGMLVAPAMGYRTEAGRALNILRKQAETMRTSQALLEAMGDGSEHALADFAKRVGRARNLDQVLGLTKASYSASWWDKFYEYWINGLLSGPTTHAVNILSNGLYRTMEEASAVVGALTSRDYSLRQVAARATAMPHAVSIGLKNAGTAFLTEEPQIDPTEKIEAARRRAIPGRLGKVIRVPGRMLQAEDEFFKAIGYHAELGDLVMGEAIKANPADPMAEFNRRMGDVMNRPDLIKQAREAAARGTFTQPLGQLGQLGTFYLTKSKVGRLIVPFVRTPTNIMKTVLDYTPAGLAREQVRSDLMAGGRSAALARGRMLVGSTVMIGAVSLAAQGILSGAGPDDPEERALLQRTGWQPYSVKVGDQWMRYNRFDPLGTLFGIAADMHELGAYMSAGDLEKIPAMLMASIALNLGDKTFLRGVTDFASAYSDPERYLATWAQNMGASVIPVAVGQAARAQDPYMREARTLIDKVRERTPVAREQLARRIDIAGEPIQSTGTGFGSPFQASAQREDPLADAMLRLNLLKSTPSRRVQGVDLEGEEYENYSTWMGRIRWQQLTPLVKSPQFRQLMQANPEAARTILERQFNAVSEKARLAWLYQHPEIIARSMTERGRARAIGSRYLEQTQ